MQGELSLGYGMRKVLTVAAFITSPVLIASCSDTPSTPTRLPTVVPTSTVFPTPTAVPEPATLVIEGLSVTTRLPTTEGFSYYRVRFFLRETTGNSGATIQRVLVTSPDDTNDNNPSCWGDTPIRLGRGGTLDAFYSDAGANALGDHCVPYTRARRHPFPLEVFVTFRDDGGREGTVKATMNVGK